MRRYAVPATLALAMVIIAGAVVLLAADARKGDCDGFALDRGAWVEAQHGDKSDAGPQAARLDRCKSLLGMTRARVRALLGPPASRSGRPDGPGQWNYGLGSYRDDFDETVLTIEFGRRGTVTTTAVG